MNRNRSLLITIAVILATVFAGNILYESVYSRYTSGESELEQKVYQLKRFRRVMLKGEAVNSESVALNMLYSGVRSRMLKVGSESIALAKLQKKIKEIASGSAITVNNYNDTDNIKFGRYLKVGGQFSIHCLMRDFSDFLHQLENSDIYINVADIKIQGINENPLVKIRLKVYGLAEIIDGGLDD